MVRGRSVKLLGAGSAILFSALGGYVTLVDPGLDAFRRQTAVDTGIFLIALISMLIRHPFTLQYALEAVDAETAAMPGFMRRITSSPAAWTVASC